MTVVKIKKHKSVILKNTKLENKINCLEKNKINIDSLRKIIIMMSNVCNGCHNLLMSMNLSDIGIEQIIAVLLAELAKVSL